ncbi:MAG TPA: MauE/DoxX family redox-associated membrane protein, partial [Euzebya sp.]|nr:MauE/DoxX family redox-associated membrane protein [Euzebya sp.]
MNPQPIVTAVVWLAAGLLVVAGGSKLPVPDAAMATLHSLRLPSGRIAARMLGLGEIVLGVAVVLVGGMPAAIALVVAYAALLAVAGRQ